jgi:hypothetical protein
MKPFTEYTINELKANILMHNQHIASINHSLTKLDDRQVADGFAVGTLVQTRWTLSQERNDLKFELEKRNNREVA